MFEVKSFQFHKEHATDNELFVLGTNTGITGLFKTLLYDDCAPHLGNPHHAPLLHELVFRAKKVKQKCGIIFDSSEQLVLYSTLTVFI